MRVRVVRVFPFDTVDAIGWSILAIYLTIVIYFWQCT